MLVEALVKTFQTKVQSVEVLRSIDLTIKRRQSLAVVGASGVGKSTLLHILGALEEPTSGRVILDGLDLYQQNSKDLARIRNRKIGFVFQFHHLLSEFNALENAAMPAMIQGLSRREAYGRAEEVLVRVGLEERLRHRIGELSGGEQQRVAVARALVVEPDLLLADEPTGNLDTKTGNRINELLVQLNEEKGLTTIVATHNLELAKLMTSQIRLIEGRIIEER
ncbi:MAG: ABC transporter ATP-binding protein [Deltaproteobacteria bacterium]|nr:ABC transporter ATP-binding protein [Deltaproteobacteria bacterium]